jgi:sugar (pentulose or hexulose) kinase
MEKKAIVSAIQKGETALGIELGSTRIKAVLIDKNFTVLADGSFSWENRLENKLWTYHLEDAILGLQKSYSSLKEDVKNKYGLELTTVGSIGISAMMHGIIALDKENKQLSPFLTWRNTNTSEATEKLTNLFDFNIPLRWTISQLYQAILNNEKHISKIAYVSTLSGYIHYLLTGKKVIGVGDASGMFPIDSDKLDYDQVMVEKFNAILKEKGLPYTLKDIFPQVLSAGDDAGCLTEEGAKLLDPEGSLKAGIPMAAPEGDAGTGMTATNSVRKRTGNVSAGTSVFAMVVLEKKLSKLYRDLDMVTTPSGRPVAMVHCNNGTSEFDQWFNLFKEFYECMGNKADVGKMYETMYKESLKASPSCDGVLYFNYLSGEPVTGLIDGRPLLVRKPESKFSFANFMRSQLYSIFASLSIGMKILEGEGVEIDRLTGHGGVFKTEGVAQRYLSCAMKAPVTVMKTAGEGGPYGMALLAAFCKWRAAGQSLEDFLDEVFSKAEGLTVMASEQELKGYGEYLESYTKLLAAEKTAVEVF